MTSVETEDDILSPVTDEELRLKPLFSMPEDLPEEERPSRYKDADTKFDPRYREAFTGLMYIGYLEKTVTIYGHTFDLQTPSQNERLEAGILHKQYINSLSSEIAWAAITVSLYLRSVDGQPLPEPIGPKDSGLSDRFFWVINNLKNVVIQQVYEEALILDSDVAEVLEELDSVGKA